MAGIYIHIPFCKVKCHYCDFHFSTNLKNQNTLVAALIKELMLKKECLAGEKIETLYFGGGTPSLLTKNQIDELIHFAKANYAFANNVEITFECNPDDLSIKKLKELKQAGVNRLSIGTQSFNDELLKFMNRAHNSAEATESIKNANKIGFDNITIDLIYGIPGLSMDLWKAELAQIDQLNIPHLSAYCLTIEENTVFGSWTKTGRLKPFEDEISLKQFQYLIDFTKERGYEHYEISNFSKPNFISKHNSAYWLGKNYLGIGPSAHSYNGKQRQWNVANNKKYIQSLVNNEPFFEQEDLSVTDQFNEYILTRLRTKWGIAIKDLRRISEKMAKAIQPTLIEQLKDGNLKFKDDTYYLTAEGKFLADAISADLFQ